MQSDRAAEARSAPVVPETDDRALARFLDRHFDGIPGLLEEFPILLGGANRERRLTVRVAGEPLALAAWRPLELRMGADRVRAAGIGLVTTHLAWRGLGLASRVVEACVEQARAAGCQLAMVFGPTRGLYGRLGFVPAGRERMTRLDKPRAPDAAKVRRGDGDDVERLLPLLESHTVGVQRSAREFRALLAVPGVSLWVLNGDAGPLAYCVEGKGRDLEGVVHEWAGELDAVRRLIQAVPGCGDEVPYLIGPDLIDPVASGEHSIGPLAQIRILDESHFGSADAHRLFGDAETPAQIPLYVWGLDSF